MIKDIVIKDLDAYKIQEYQQNRSPCYFVDFMSEVILGKKAVGYKNFSYNEWFTPPPHDYQKLSLNKPEVPPFILTEALVQVFLMTFLTLPENKGKKTAMITSDVEYLGKVYCGKKMDITADLNSFKRGLAKGKVSGAVEGEEVCRAEFIVAIPDIVNQFKPKTS